LIGDIEEKRPALLSARTSFRRVLSRFVKSIKSEALNKFIPMGEDFLRHVIKEYLEHYHSERNHQGEDIGNALLFPDDRMDGDPGGEIVTDTRLGGLLKFYWRDQKDVA